MKKKRVFIFLLIIVFLTFLSIFYPKLTGKSVEKNELRYEREKINLTEVIDGDTFDSSVGRVRLLGVNTPEKNMLFYEEAKSFLLHFRGKNAEVLREKEDEDKYGRKLRYLFYEDRLINVEILEQGLGHLYVYDDIFYLDKLERAEEFARKNEVGIWKKSSKSSCLRLIELRKEEPERLVLENSCEKMNVIVKDDATHIYKIELEKGRFEKNFSRIWNDDEDTLYIWDEEGLLVWERYGVRRMKISSFLILQVLF